MLELNEGRGLAKMAEPLGMGVSGSFIMQVMALLGLLMWLAIAIVIIVVAYLILVNVLGSQKQKGIANKPFKVVGRKMGRKGKGIYG